MESTRPIRALTRGLDALTVLNLRNGATVSEVAQEIRLPRTTVYRILETLCDAGFVFRDSADDRYRLTVLVRGLSDGFDDESWVTDIAKPYLYELCRQIVWPVAIATLSGTSMVVRETTDHLSPLTVERYSAGFRVPLLTSAFGRMYLATCPVAQRDSLLGILSRSSKQEDKLARDAVEVSRLLAETKAQGFAVTARSRRASDDISIAVPVALEDRVLAILAARFSAGALPAAAAVDRFVPKLHECAARIRSGYLQQVSGGTA